MGRGRKSTGLSDQAKVLMTEVGWLNAMAEIFETLKEGMCTRDETTALTSARRCLDSFKDAREARELHDMEERLDALERTLSGTRGSSQRASSATTPALPEGTPTH